MTIDPQNYPDVVWSVFGAHRIEKVTPKRVYVRRENLGYLAFSDPEGAEDSTLLRVDRAEFDAALAGERGGDVRATGGYPDRLNVFPVDDPRRCHEGRIACPLGIDPGNVAEARIAALRKLAAAESEDQRERIRDAYYAAVDRIGYDGLSGKSIALDRADSERILELRGARVSGVETTCQDQARMAQVAVYRLIGAASSVAFHLRQVIDRRAWESCGFDSMAEWIVGAPDRCGLWMSTDRLDAVLRVMESAVYHDLIEDRDAAQVGDAIERTRDEMKRQDAPQSTIARP